MKKTFLFIFLISIIFVNAQEIKVETLSKKDSLTIMKVNLNPQQLNIQNETTAKNIVLKVYYNSNGSIQNEFKKYKSVTDEITFFYAKNYEKRELEMQFIFDEKLKKIYSKKDFEQLMKIVEILEYNVFTVDGFSGTRAYDALEKSL
jgi:hypothetical protein